jgi:hypothetical protein
MILMRLIHIEKRLERLMTARSKRRRLRQGFGGQGRASNRKIKLRKRKANRS